MARDITFTSRYSDPVPLDVRKRAGSVSYLRTSGSLRSSFLWLRIVADRRRRTDVRRRVVRHERKENDHELAKSGPWHGARAEGGEDHVIVGVGLPIEEDPPRHSSRRSVPPGPGCSARTWANSSTTVRLSAARARRPGSTDAVPPASSKTEPVAPKQVRALVHDRYLALPFEQLFLASGRNRPLSLPRFVVLRRPGPIVRPLLSEYGPRR